MESLNIAMPIVGLSLGGCGSLTLEHGLRKLPGVLEVYVNPATETAYVRYDRERLNRDAIANAIHRFGYETARGAGGR